MPPTPKSTWIQCDNCLISFVNKDSDQHSNDCPPDLPNLKYNFVSNNILYGNLDLKIAENIKNLSSNEKDNLVFLSQSAIQLCSLAIGEWCIVKLLNSDNPAPIAKIVWPTTEKSLTSVLLTKNALNLSFRDTNQPVTVTAIPNLNDIPKANNIIVIVLNGPKSFEITSELKNRLENLYCKKLFTNGNKISLIFYGKLLKFEIKSIESDQNIELDLCNLKLNDCNKFYLTHEGTKWTLFKNEFDYEKETNSQLEIKIAGVDRELNEIRELIKECFENSSKLRSLPACRSVLLYGNSGTGKTSIVNLLSSELKHINTVKISASDLYSKYSGNTDDTIKQLFQNAIDQEPSIIILDEIDILCPPRSSRLTESEKRMVSTMLTMLDRLNDSRKLRIFILATTNKLENIDPTFRRCGRFDREIEIPTPNPIARRQILEILLDGADHGLGLNDIQEIAGKTHGFVGADLVALCSRAALYAGKRSDRITVDDLNCALNFVRPSAMREVQIEVPNVKWSDIGGEDKLKLILKQAVEWPLKHGDSFLRLGIQPPRGVLMFGPPGCSKTMIAKALATESGLNFLSIKGPELFSKWVGESEKAVREVFRKARQVAPSIIFFDEIDALGGERSSGSSTSVQERVLAQLLTELDGVTPLRDVTVLAATNRPDRIDKALIRPGRLDRIVYVPLPDRNTRREILKIKFAKMPVANDVNIEDLVELTDGYSGAEVNAVCQEAAMAALEDDLNIKSVEVKHFSRALKVTVPRTPSSLIKIYEEYV